MDENVDARLVSLFEDRGHNVSRLVADYPAGLPDHRVLEIAQAENRILVTSDRDFGRLVFQERLKHTGVILLRLGDYAHLSIKVARLAHVLEDYGDRLDQFLVVGLRRVRIRCAPPD